MFAQHRLKAFVTSEKAFSLRQQVPSPTKVLVDGQQQTRLNKILARRVRRFRAKDIEEFLVRWTGYSNAHDSWKTRESLNYGGELEQITEFEQAPSLIYGRPSERESSGEDSTTAATAS
ncbi:hypothetical protein CYMTET_39721 [Cymbomonas tetramitiformis]|uniref:Chromo domain-containing protein n=1 Tax=Cymbomonas tetramitiformis TaxID=36881 RepID=A0AAE0CAQ7_9CHLO|nr:hypothetical protein CYMTET_39721 [Cymbomonas tetramitiformis]